MKKVLLSLTLPLVLISLFIYSNSRSNTDGYEGSSTFTFKVDREGCMGDKVSIFLKGEKNKTVGNCTISNDGQCILAVTPGKYKLQAVTGNCESIEVTLTHPGKENINIELSFAER